MYFNLFQWSTNGDLKLSTNHYSFGYWRWEQALYLEKLMSGPILKYEELSNIVALIEGVQTQNSQDIYNMNY